MQYIFGIVEINDRPVENLKTVGEAHTDLEGYQQHVAEYPDSTVTDRFRVVEKYRSAEDEAGNCYDWYVIADHYRYIDRYAQAQTDIADLRAQVDYIGMMADIL